MPYARSRTARSFECAQCNGVFTAMRFGAEHPRRFCSPRCNKEFHFPERPLADRFWEKVAKGGPGECWEWQASKFPFGYGKINLGGRTGYAHRVSFQIHHGSIPKGKHVCHSCDNPGCVNPAHLWLGTPRDNNADMRAKGRARDCAPRGERHGNARLTSLQVNEVKRLRAEGLTYAAIAQRVGTSPTNAHKISNGLSRRMG